VRLAGFLGTTPHSGGPKTFDIKPSPLCSLSDAPKEKKKVRAPLTPLQPPKLAFAKLGTQVQAPVSSSSKIVFKARVLLPFNEKQATSGSFTIF
jgi:hypothetical protein